MSDQHPYGTQPGQQPPAYAQQSSGPPAQGFATPPGAPAWAGQQAYGQQSAQPGLDPQYAQYGQPQYAQPPSGAPEYAGAPEFAHWGLRVGSALLDGLVSLAPLVVLGIVGGVLAAATGSDGVVGGVVALGYLASFGVGLWNVAFRQGRTGRTVGKSVVGTRLLNERTAQPLGSGMAFVRGLAHVLDSWSLMIGYLWPLWDPKRQTFADKVIGSVVVKG